MSLCPSLPGPRCTREDSCVSSPCANGGSCSPGNGGKYTCNCPKGYQGHRCLNDTNECAISPGLCSNRGECVNTPGSYHCVCPMGYTGRHCETPYVPCSPSPCVNGGTCRQTSDTSYWCHCLPGEQRPMSTPPPPSPRTGQEAEM